jgi:hypothetical protein
MIKIALATMVGALVLSGDYYKFFDNIAEGGASK